MYDFSGDNIRGYSPIDLTELKAIGDIRQDLDAIVTDISVRLSTLGYDTEYYTSNGQSNVTSMVGFDITVGCDNITTNDMSSAFVTGDVLTIIGRTFLGSTFPDPLTQIPLVLERIFDIKEILTNMNYGLYEIHLELLQRDMQDFAADFKSLQTPLHSLEMGNDNIHSRGNDTVVGDSATLYYQIDRDAFEDFGYTFSFDELEAAPDLRSIATERQDSLAVHIETNLRPSIPLSNQELNAVPFADLPFFIFIGIDTVKLSDNSVVAVGDYAAIGIVYSMEQTNVRELSKYYTSVDILRKKQGVEAFLPSLSSLGRNGDFFYQRYASDKVKLVEPTLHGDFFFGQSEENIVLGDFLTAACVSIEESFTLDDKQDFYGTFLNAEWAQYFDEDTINVIGLGSPIWIGQVSNDNVNGTVVKSKAVQELTDNMERFFDGHEISKQIIDDLYFNTIPYPFNSVGLRNVDGFNSTTSTGGQFTIPSSTYVPSHTLSLYFPNGHKSETDTSTSIASSSSIVPQTTASTSATNTAETASTSLSSTLPPPTTTSTEASSSTTIVTSTTSTTVLSTPNPACAVEDWYFVSNNGRVRGCSWIGERTNKRCDKEGGFGTCFGKTTCKDNPRYDTTTCSMMLARFACPDECKLSSASRNLRAIPNLLLETSKPGSGGNKLRSRKE